MSDFPENISCPCVILKRIKESDNYMDVVNRIVTGINRAEKMAGPSENRSLLIPLPGRFVLDLKNPGGSDIGCLSGDSDSLYYPLFPAESTVFLTF